ncbi:MAG: Holliday junction resolvase RuvX [Anaerolineae bacterium]|nr:Holliday junction resolvase RuvX [Anaerolineae bacterium]
MRYLALDLGEKYIGLAISDSLGMLARPLEVMRRTSRAADFAHLAGLIAEHQVDALVMGLPLNMDGAEGPQAAWVRDYTAEMAATLGLPVQFWDERLTTIEAADILQAQGKRTLGMRIDAVAAAVILQSFLDAHPATREQT